MDRLLKIARSATPETGVQFRPNTYGEDGLRAFLRDVLALANASVEGNRYIVVGVDFDAKGRKRTHAIDSDDFSGKPSYQSLANEYIEPPIRIRYKPVSFDGTRVGVFEIGDCQDRPYMMRVDFSEQLRRGDAYARVKDAAVKMGRRQLMELFERKFRDSVSAGDIEVGFPGDIIHKHTCSCRPASCPRCRRPSLRHKLQEIAEYPQPISERILAPRRWWRDSPTRGSTAPRIPYVDRSPEDILIELNQIRSRNTATRTITILFDKRKQRNLQLVVYTTRATSR